jgi:hypothetical protein
VVPLRDLAVGLEDVAGFVALDRGGLAEQLRIPGFAEPHGLRKLRRRDRFQVLAAPSTRAAKRDAVETFHVAGAVDAQARDTRVSAERCDLFLQRHQRKNVVDAGFCRQIGILERVPMMLRPCER